MPLRNSYQLKICRLKIEPQVSKLKGNDTGYGIGDTGYRIRDTGFKIRDSGYRIQDTGYWILDTGS